MTGIAPSGRNDHPGDGPVYLLVPPSAVPAPPIRATPAELLRLAAPQRDPCLLSACHDGQVRSVGLVLGAGGAVGGAYHAGALAALADATGWDPRTADLVVGTSAGAATAASLRAGLSAADLCARVTGRDAVGRGRRAGRRRPRSAAPRAPRRSRRSSSAHGRCGRSLPQAPGCSARPCCEPARPAGASRWPASSLPGARPPPPSATGSGPRSAPTNDGRPIRPGSWPIARGTPDASCSGATTSRCPTSPWPSRRPRPCPGGSRRCRRPRAATSTAPCSRPPTPTWWPVSASTWSSCPHP